ncbi:MAG: guanylate kinase [Fibrobacteres bacterium]|nr:guanylate kinase [Fibrobacterota bacterium]
MHPKIFVLSAPSGAGKSTLIRRILPKVSNLVFSISATTRKPRPMEQDGREYFFKSKEEFLHMIENDELAEWQEVFGNYYGTPKSFITGNIAKGNSLILDIDVYGKTKLDKVFPENVGIFITAPSVGEITNRLASRKTESAEDLAKRVAKAEEEIAYATTKGNYKYTIVNNILDDAEIELLDIIKSEHGKENGK